ncbi:MAG: sigma-70 family RNA polymerase sigma factor [Pseudoxanthomonas sp.]
MARHTDRQEQFRELIERNRKIVFKVANTYAWHPDDREELAQEIAAQLWRAFPAYDGLRPFSTWMYRIALNVAISQVRSGNRRGRYSVPLDEHLHDIADESASDPESDQQVRALHRFIAQLDKLNRALLLLYLEDQSYRQIADILGISETNVATKLSRLKQRIRNEI